jgi:hypothetical protein
MFPFLFSFFRDVVSTLTCWFTFDGSDEYISVSDDDTLDFDTSKQFSLSGWFRFNSLGTTQYLMSKQESSGNFRGYFKWCRMGTRRCNIKF